MKLIIIYCFALLLCLSLSIQKSDSKKLKRLPKKITLKIPFNETYTLTLNLKEEKDEVPEVDIVADDEKGVMVTEPADKDEHTAVYKSKKNNALFTVTLFSNETVYKLTYIGNFFIKKQEYNVMPDDFGEDTIGDRAEEVFIFEIEDQHYILYKLKASRKINLRNDELYKDSSKDSTYADILKEIDGEVESDIQMSNPSDGKQKLITELLVIIDVTTYNKFLRFSKNNHTNTVRHLKFYYTHIMNAVNDRYQSIQHPQFSWSMVVTSMYIARTDTEAPFTTLPYVRDAHNILDGTRALNVMNRWVKKHMRSRTFKWPTFDLTLMFHNIDMGVLLGMAYEGGVCGALPVGLVRNSGAHETIFIVAHETGHLMGSKHDDSTECSPEHPFIMSKFVIRHKGNFDNENLFSPCTIQQFVKHITDLNVANNNCLLNEPSHHESMKGVTTPKRLLGQIYSIDFQCSVVYGKESQFCGDAIESDELCKNIQCVIPESNNCSMSENFRAMDGTSCGSKRWCMIGRCVPDSRAPAFTAEKCMNADSKSNFSTDNVFVSTCALIKHRYTHLCQEQKYKSLCCETCESIKGQTNSGGKEKPWCRNKAGWCEKYVAEKPKSCDVVRKTCCHACKDR